MEWTAHGATVECGWSSTPGASWNRGDTGPNRKNSASAWTHSAIVGDPKRGVGILNNPLYKGVVVWGRSKWTPSAADSSVRLVKTIADTEWVIEHNESLRMVSDELWEAVRVVQTASNPRREAVRVGVAKRRKFRFRSKYWLGGTLVCGLCGCNFIGDGATDYLCPAHTVGSCENDLRFRRDDVHRAVFAHLAAHVFSDDMQRREIARIESELQERARREDAAERSVEDRPEIKRLDAQATAIRGMPLHEAAREAALAAIQREKAEIIAFASGKRPAAENRARRLLARLPDVVEAHKRLVSDALKTLTRPDIIAAAAEATRRLLEDGKIVLVPNADHSGVIGPIHLKGLGDHVLEAVGWRRKRNEIKEKLSGSGGRISLPSTSVRLSLAI